MQVTVSAATVTFRLPEFEPLVPLPLVTPAELVALKVKALGLPAVSAGTGEPWKAHWRMSSSGAAEPEVPVPQAFVLTVPVPVPALPGSVPVLLPPDRKE